MDFCAVSITELDDICEVSDIVFLQFWFGWTMEMQNIQLGIVLQGRLVIIHKDGAKVGLNSMVARFKTVKELQRKTESMNFSFPPATVWTAVPQPRVKYDDILPLDFDILPTSSFFLSHHS
jgi:hypothetical protein